MRFQVKYFVAFLILLVIELYIALFINDHIIRPFVGDILVVMLIYCFLMSLFKIESKTAIVAVFIFSSSIEFSQHLHFIKVLNLEEYAVAHWILGSSFNWWDFLAYGIGLLITSMLEIFLRKRSHNNPK